MADCGAVVVDTISKMPLFLRVDWECKGPESVEAILSALQVMADYQLRHPYPGVLTYHFTRPDPDSRPNFLQFTELYADVAVFWAHVNDKSVIKAFQAGFSPPNKHKLRSSFYSYGPMLEAQPNVKKTCDMLDSKYPCTTVGYLLNEAPDFDTSSDDPGPVLMLMKLTARKAKKSSGLFDAEGNVENVTQVFRELISMESNKAITWHVSRPESQTHPNVFEITATYAGNEKLVAHLESEKAQSLLRSLVGLSASIECKVYGSVGSEVTRVFDKAGFPYKVANTDVGYILHPQAKDAFT